MADHLDEPPQKRMKYQQSTGVSDQDVLSNYDILGLEENLPDELVYQTDPTVGNKPGQGPDGPQLNGEDPGVPNVALRQMQQQQMHHLLQQQQQSNKNALPTNVLNMGPLGQKNVNLLSPPNMQGNMSANMGVGGMVNSMPMSISNNGTQTMSSMQSMNSIAQGNVSNMIITNSNMGMGGAMSSGGLVSNQLKQQIGTSPLLGAVQSNQGNQGLHHGSHQVGLQNGPIMGVAVGQIVRQQHIVRGPNPHLMGSGPRMQSPNIGQINNMGGPNGPYGYGNPGQQAMNVNAGGGGPQQSMLVNSISQQRIPPNIVMQGNRPGGPIGTNIGLGAIGNDGGLQQGGQVQPTGVQQTAPQPQAVGPTGAQPRPQTAAVQQNPGGMQQQPQQQNPGTAQQSSNTSAAIEKKKQIQQQLMLLLHAHKCTRRESENPNNSTKCNVLYCKTMKDVLSHMANCKANKDCDYPHCISSRQILVHWKNCTRPDCAICLPFRQTDKYRPPVSNANNPGGAPSGVQPQQPQQQVGGNVNMAGTSMPGAPSPAALGAAKQSQELAQLQQQQQQQQNAAQNQEVRRFEAIQGMQGGPVSSASSILPSNTVGAPQVAQGIRMSGPPVRVIVPNQGVPQNTNQMLANSVLMGNDMGGNSISPSVGGAGGASNHVLPVGSQQGQPGMPSQSGVGAPQQNNQQAQQQGNIPQSVGGQMFNAANAESAVKAMAGAQLGQMKMGALSNQQLGTAGPTSGNTKDWHNTVTPDLRNHLVHKLVQAIFPTSDQATMMDKRMHNLVSYAEKVERDMYEMANSRSEYYHLLAEKIYKIQKELDEKRQRRKEQQMMMQQQQQQQQAAGGCGPSPQSLPGHQQMRPLGQPSGMVVQMGGNQAICPSNTLGSVMQRAPGGGLIGQGPQQAAGMRSHSPGMVNVGMQQSRMQFNPNQGNMGNLVVGPPGPSPNSSSQQNLVVQNPVLSPFTGQAMSAGNSANLTPPTSVAAAAQFMNANGSTVTGATGSLSQQTLLQQSQFNDVMKARLGLTGAAPGPNQQAQQPQPTSQQQQQAPQPTNASQQIVSSSSASSIVQQNVVPPQTPSPFSSAGQMQTSQSSNTNAFNTMSRNSNSNLPPTPTSLDALGSVSSASMVPVASPSPILSSNGPIPVSTPNPPSVSSLLQPKVEPLSPTLMTSPSQTATNVTQSLSASLGIGQPSTGSIGKGGGNSNSAISLPPSRPSSSSNLSSQMAALEAAARDRDENTPSPDMGGGASQKGKLDSVKQEDDYKKDMDENDSGSQLDNSEGGGKGVNNEVVKTEIKSEPMDLDGGAGGSGAVGNNMDGTLDSKDDIKVKDEPMSPSQQDNKTGIKMEVKQVCPEPIVPNATDKKKKCLFKPEELRQALMPTLEKLLQTDPESLPFKSPVDPQALGIPDYFDIVKKPMDLSTIRNKLMTGQYSDPWEYVDDVWLMFDNAWLYNRKTSRVYRYCTKLSEVFEQEIDPVMNMLGYCCGRKYTFNPQVLCCYGKQLCTIPRDAKYYSYQNSLKAYGVVSDRYTFCQKCFNEIPGDTVTLGDDPLQSQTQIKKDQFKEMKNDHLELEPFVDCLECGRKQHQICVLYLDTVFPGGFYCDNCLKKKGIKRKENKFNAKRLPTTKLGIYIETRVNNFLKKKEAGAGEVHIRVVSSSDKTVEVKPGMRRRFTENKEFSAEFPYRAKALFAFEEVDGVDVCFFGMHVQEYGSECPPPNTRRVYIAYLDSVHFFRPRQFRTAVYHEILLGYMDYVKQLGYTMAHIWACPPSEGDDYIFHCHPPDQKIPKPKRLQEWYKKMLDKGMIERTIQDYKDILKQAMEDKLSSATELPYFEGDFWPNVLEESIKELDQEEEEKRKQAEAAEAAANAMFSMNDDNETSCDGKKKGQKKAKKSNKSKAAQRKNNKKSNEQQTGNDLSAKIYATMEKHKEVFFVIRLHSAQSAASLAPIQDPDPPMNCDLMDGRDAFLTMARDKHFEFSSLRRAQFSTLCMLYELHNQGQDKFVYTCNNCKTPVETRFHCTVCDDFDLCTVCKDKVGHPHKMEKLGFDLDDGSSPTDMKQANPQEARKQSIQRCIQSLVHACQCRDANCRLPSCQKMKRVVTHTKNCKRKTNGGCPICKQLIALCCYHAKHCQEAKCPVPFCPNIKHKLKQQQLQQRLQQAQLLRRRMAVMNTTRTVAPTAPGLPGSGVPALPALPAGSTPGAGGMSPSSVSSPVSQMSGMTSPHQAGIGHKAGTQTPPANVLQVVKQVQEEAARQQVPHGGAFGKLTPTGPQMAPPVMQRQLIPNQQQPQRLPFENPGNIPNMLMDQWGRYPNNGNQPGLRPPIQNQMMQPNTMQQQQGMGAVVGSSSNQIMCGMRPTGQTPIPNQLSQQQISQIMQQIKNGNSAETSKILQVLKSQPLLMAAIIKQRQQSQNAGAANQNTQQQQQQQQQPLQPQQPHPQQQQQAGHLPHMMGQPQQQQQQAQQILPNQAVRMPMQNAMMGQCGTNQMQQQQQGVGPNQWYNKNIFRQMPMSYPAPPYPQRPRAPQMGGFQGNAFQAEQQYAALQQGLKANNPQQGGGVMSSQQLLQAQQGQNVMGPPTPHSIQQQLMQSVRSPPPIRSPQPTPSPRSAPSPRAQPSASPRAQPSPHHLPSHSPAPQPGGPDLHNHMHPHQSPIPGGPGDTVGPGSDGQPMTAQDQLTKFVEQL